MGYKWITVTGDCGKTSFKVSQGSDRIYVYNGSGNSIGETRTMEDAISLIKATYGKKVWSVDIGEDIASCFSGSSPVLTPTGWRHISNLQPGDFVLSLSLPRLTLEVETVTRRHDHPIAQIWEIHIAGTSSPISTTRHHPFLTHQGWVSACQLKPGQILIDMGSCSKMDQRVRTAVKTERFEPVHNLITTGSHTYVVSGFVVHNFVFARGIRTFLNQIFIDPRWRNARLKQLQESSDPFPEFSL